MTTKQTELFSPMEAPANRQKPNYGKLRDRADNHRKMVTERMRKLCAEAGLDSQYIGLHPHNAMVAYNAGRPWKGVNYSKVRKILWLERTKLFAASHALSALYKRKGYEAFDWSNQG